MRNIKQAELVEIIRKHKIWLAGESGGQNADLRSADLRSANLRSANLRSADLRSANLSYANLRSANLSSANLRYANLSYANLRSADLSSADLSYANLRSADLRSANLSYADLRDTIMADINWLAYIGIVPDKKGVAYAYKMTKSNGDGPFNGGIDYTAETIFEVAEMDTDVNRDCGAGINLSTFRWCLNNFTDKTYRLFMMKFNVNDAVCPIGSDGRFRVLKCSKVGECGWTGNLKKA